MKIQKTMTMTMQMGIVTMKMIIKLSIIGKDIHDYKPWFKYDVAPRFICDLIGYFCLFTKLLLSSSQCNLQLGTLLHSCTFSSPLSTNLVTLANLDCHTLSTNVVLVDSIIK